MRRVYLYLIGALILLTVGGCERIDKIDPDDPSTHRNSDFLYDLNAVPEICLKPADSELT